MTDTAAAEIEDKITAELVGDIRRDSFIKSSKERAMDKYGLTHGVIFTGSFVDKKFAGHDWTTKKRFIWLDPQKKIFHWSKVSDIKQPHKNFKLKAVKGARALGPKSFEIYFENGDAMQISVDSESLNNEWIKVADAMAGPTKGLPESN